MKINHAKIAAAQKLQRKIEDSLAEAVACGIRPDRLIVEGGRAVGVAFLQGGVARVARSRGEVILAAGAIGSPAILQRSGIGDAGRLSSLGIAPAVDRLGQQARARQHFDRALELSAGKLAAPYVTYAEAVCVQQQQRTEFTKYLEAALAIDAYAVPEARLANLVAQRRARWLLGRIDELFVE